MSLDINIEKATLNIMDTSLGIPVIAEKEMSLEKDINEFISKHIEKCLKDVEIKKTRFKTTDNIFYDTILKYKEEKNFIKTSEKISKRYYDIMVNFPNISLGDLMIIDVKIHGVKHLAILKLNYKDSYIHYTEDNEGVVNSIIRQPCSLPLESQKIDEFAIINLESYIILLKEKKFDLNGEKSAYISKHLLKCDLVKSDKEKVKIITKASNKLIKEYYDNDIELKNKVKTVINQNIEENRNLDLEHVAEQVFGSKDMVDACKEEIKKKGIDDKEIKVNENYASKMKTKQRLVTESGIEIKVPYTFLSNKEKIEFINNPDGTISILIKNIDSIEDK